MFWEWNLLISPRNISYAIQYNYTTINLYRGVKVISQLLVVCLIGNFVYGAWFVLLIMMMAPTPLKDKITFHVLYFPFRWSL